MHGEFPKNLKYLWNHPDLSQKTKEKIAYHNGKEYFQLNRKNSAPLRGRRTEMTKIILLGPVGRNNGPTIACV